MSTAVNGIVGMSNGAGTGASIGGSSGGGWGAAIGGILGGALGLGSGLLSSGGTSAAQQLDMLKKYYQPTKAGWSWAQLENQYAIEQYRKQLQSSASTDLNLSQSMNRLLPSAQVEGLRLAGINPILAVLGSGFSPIQSSASASGSSAARVPGGLSKPARHINSAGSAMDFAKVLGGAIDAEVENRQADTSNKKVMRSNIEAQTDNIEAQNDLIHAQADKVRADTHKSEVDTKKSATEEKWGNHALGRFALGLLSTMYSGINFAPADNLVPNSAKKGEQPIVINGDFSGSNPKNGRDERKINLKLPKDVRQMIPSM